MSAETFECRDVDDPPELSCAIQATSPREAAERFSAIRDREACEYPAEREVVVERADGSEVTFVVELRSAPEYSARLKRKGGAA
jgi:hypothetical protein